MEALLGIIIGVLMTTGVVTYLKSINKKRLVNNQSILLVDKVKKVVSTHFQNLKYLR